MIRAALYAPWPEGARSLPGLASIGVLVVAYVLSSLPVIIGTVILTLQAGGTQPSVVDLLPLLLGQFVLWAVLTALWAGLVERRGASSLGLSWRGAGGRFAVGLLVGILMLTLTSLGGLAAMAVMAPADGPALVAAADTRSVPLAFAGLLGLVALGFLIQGAVEELVFRGWLMSALVARWGLRTGVIVTSTAFMLLHAHVLVSGLVFGISALVTLGLTGLVFAMLCLWRGSIIEACGAHGMFNALAVAVPAIALYAVSPDLDAGEILSRVLTSATGTGGEGTGLPPQVFGQMAAMAVLVVALGVFAMRRHDTTSVQETQSPD
ncbi:CPBP family intramembrane metalloprotease [Hyphomonadaceae bacterium BL14]|nr:CPBP family intramembrane metalloprotease [Hyphomonadaceae bacterium BL14]